MSDQVAGGGDHQHKVQLVHAHVHLDVHVGVKTGVKIVKTCADFNCAQLRPDEDEGMCEAGSTRSALG